MKLRASSISKLRLAGFKGVSLEDLLMILSVRYPKFIGGSSVSDVWWIHLKDTNDNDLEKALVKEYIKHYGN